MNLKHIRLCLMVCSLILVLQNLGGLAQENSDASTAGTQHASTIRDGQHDFDFEIGTWKIHLSRLQDPLGGSTTWVEFDGTSVTRKVWDGRANLEEFETDSPTRSHRRSDFAPVQSADSSVEYLLGQQQGPALGQPIQPMVGEFKNGRGEFYDQEQWKGRSVLVRFVWSKITPNSAHFEQSFSDDGGKTWEVNWITDQTTGER